VVIVTFDTTRADRIGCYGYADAQTPSLDRLAADGVLFEQAVSTVPTTLPAHATIFTGLYPQDHGVRYNIFYTLSPEAVTLAERLEDAGFATAGFVASQILARRHGLDQGFAVYSEPTEQADPSSDHPVRSMERRAAVGVDAALEWLESHAGERIFLWLHLYDPHIPYNPPFPFSSRFRDRPYQGEIAYADAQFGRLLERLQRDAAWPETLVIAVGDHGEGLYEHDERWHSMLVYESTQHVPLIIHAPGAAPGRVSRPVSLADITPTVLDLLGLPANEHARGVSLRPALEGRELPLGAIYFESLTGALVYGWQELTGVRHGRWKLIDSKAPELFDLDEDPAEQTDLAPFEPERVSELRAALLDLREPLGSLASGKGLAPARLDPETERMLASLGYVAGGAGGTSVEGAPHPRQMMDLEAELLSAMGAVARGQWDYVEDLCRYTLGRDPTNKWALVHMPLSLARQQRYDEALEHVELALRIYPDSERAYQVLADIHKSRGADELAFQALRRGLDAIPKSEMLTYFAAVAAFDAAHADVCEAEVPRAVAAFPESGRLLVLQARCEARRDDPEAALESLRAAVGKGFRWLKPLEKVEEFAEVVRLPAFTDLVRQVEEEAADGDGAGQAPPPPHRN
jgi:arylsulfatase A-like enzyme